MAEKHICYFRVSTSKQGQSGLGLEAQRGTVKQYLSRNGHQVIGEHVEIESGGKNNRPELQKAIRACRLKGARLVVAKLDRLSRDLHFITQLQSAGVPFVVAEMPQATELTIHIYAAMAQHERKVIAQRTKDALAMAKARGVQLGNPCLRKGEQIPGSGNTMPAIQARKIAAATFAEDMLPVIQRVQADGADSLRKVADRLNIEGYVTRRGGKWQANSVKRLLDRTDR